MCHLRWLILPDFYSHAPYGTWRTFICEWADGGGFLLTRPLRDVTRFSSPCFFCSLFLLTRPLRDVTSWLAFLIFILVFLLTRPLRDVTNPLFRICQLFSISTHTPLTGRDLVRFRLCSRIAISTHTPLTGRDIPESLIACSNKHFYSHAPYGTWQTYPVPLIGDVEFLLTRPLRDVTKGRNYIGSVGVFLLTRPLRDVTLTH